MLALIFLASAVRQNTIPALDSLATARDKDGLAKLADKSLLKARPHVFDFLTSGGSYGVGRFGWHVYALKDIGSGSGLAIFSTPLTCEDMGEQVFAWNGKKLTGYVPEDETFGVRVLDHNIVAHFEPDKKMASFEDTILFERDKRLKSFLFRLGDDYSIGSITDRVGHSVSFASAGGVVSVAEPSSGDKFAYTIKYSGIVDRPQYAGSVSTQEILLAQDYWYVTVGRGPAPYSLTSYTPANWNVVGQGVKIGESPAGEFTKTVFRMDLPVVYYSFSAAPFTVSSDRIGTWDFKSYSKSLTESDLHLENEVQAPVIDFYNKNFAPYPFPTWGTVITPSYGGGALEAYSYATYGTMPGEDSHEPSHTWWGGILPNSYLKSQWNESFAVFSEGLFQRERDLGNHAEREEAYISEPATESLYQTATVENAPPEIGPAAGALGYGKGSAVLQMLENEIGTDNFLRAVKEWIRSHPKGELAEWSGFETAVNKVMAADYSWFFDEWLRRPGWPEFSVGNVHWSTGTLTGQLQFNGPAYQMTLEVLGESEDGKREIKRLRITGSGPLEVPFAQKPALVSFDPWHRILRNYNANENTVSIRSVLAGAKRYTDPLHSDWLPYFKSQTQDLADLPQDLNGVLVVGSPASLPAMADLLTKAGFTLEGDSLTYDGTTIDVNKGAAIAVVDLPNGGHCCIALGKTLLEPNVGRSRLCLVDQYGRFLRGVTEPKTSGALTFKL